MNPINRILSNEDLRSRVPAAFAPVAHPEMSDVYSHVTTINVVDALRDDGWQVVDAKQTRSRDPENVPHNRHQLTLTHPELPEVEQGRPQMLLGNSGNGTSAVRLLGGFLRFACLNQLYSGVKVVGGVYYHRGSSLEDRVVAGARDLRSNFGKVLAAFQVWNQIELDPVRRVTFEASALALRYPGRVLAETGDFGTPCRNADEGTSLWLTYNRCQESLIRGGFRLASSPAWESSRRIRKVTGISSAERINTGLWDLAETYASN